MKYKMYPFCTGQFLWPHQYDKISVLTYLYIENQQNMEFDYKCGSVQTSPLQTIGTITSKNLKKKKMQDVPLFSLCDA